MARKGTYLQIDVFVANRYFIPFHDLFPHPNLDAVEGTIGCVRSPRPPRRRAEQLSFGIFQHQPSRDEQRLIGEVNDSDQFLAFRFALGDDPPLIIKINVTGFHAERLLRTAASFPGDGNQVFEGIRARKRQQLLILSYRETDFSRFPRGNFKICNWVCVDVALLFRPAKATLYGSHVIPLRGDGKPRQLVDPFGDVERLQLSDTERRVLCREFLEQVTVPLKGLLSPILLNPAEKLVDECDEILTRNLAILFRLKHQPVILGKRSVFIRTEGDLLVIELDKPAPSLTEPRLWNSWHLTNPPD